MRHACSSSGPLGLGRDKRWQCAHPTYFLLILTSLLNPENVRPTVHAIIPCSAAGSGWQRPIHQCAAVRATEADPALHVQAHAEHYSGALSNNYSRTKRTLVRACCGTGPCVGRKIWSSKLSLVWLRFGRSVCDGSCNLCFKSFICAQRAATAVVVGECSCWLPRFQLPTTN